MDEEYIRNRITELRLKKGVSEYQMSLELGAESQLHPGNFVRSVAPIHEAVSQYL